MLLSYVTLYYEWKISYISAYDVLITYQLLCFYLYSSSMDRALSMMTSSIRTLYVDFILMKS